MRGFRHRVQVEWSEAGGDYAARVPDLDLMARGDTPEEAVAEVCAAAERILAVRERRGEPIPEPKLAIDYSGQLRLRLPRSLHARLAALAVDEGVSLNHLLLALIAEGLGRRRRRGPAKPM